MSNRCRLAEGPRISTLLRSCLHKQRTARRALDGVVCFSISEICLCGANSLVYAGFPTVYWKLDPARVCMKLNILETIRFYFGRWIALKKNTKEQLFFDQKQLLDLLRICPFEITQNLIPHWWRNKIWMSLDGKFIWREKNYFFQSCLRDTCWIYWVQ